MIRIVQFTHFNNKLYDVEFYIFNSSKVTEICESIQRIRIYLNLLDVLIYLRENVDFYKYGIVFHFFFW